MQSAVHLNELVTTTDRQDAEGNVLEWIELHNSGNQDVNLNGYSLTDSPNNPQKWVFPSVTISAQGYLVVYTTGLDRKDPLELHTNFSLKREGETVALFDASQREIDRVTYPAQQRDVSYGRYPDGTGDWYYFSDSTRNRRNVTERSQGILPKPLFSQPAGVYTNTVRLLLISQKEAAEIRYTTDGSTPNQNSALYQNPIEITSTTPVRAQAFQGGFISSDVVTNSYVFLTEPQIIPVMSIVTDPGNLFDQRNGIYANATRQGVDWERPTSFEYFRANGVRMFGVDAGLRIHGGASRQRADKKSFRVYFRDQYGPGKLNAPVIPYTNITEFDSFILRAGYNDSWVHWDEIERRVAVYVSDQLGRNLHKEMDGKIISHGTYAELYLNRAYWGIYNICERIDSDFLESYTGVEEWDIYNDDELKEGDNTEWNTLRNYILRTNFREDAVFDEVQNLVDLEQITSYYILNIYAQNHDWPHHNWYAVRERTPNGRWKFVIWDIEDSFGSGASRGSFNLNTFNVARQGGTIGDLFNRLTQNERYKDYLLQQLEKYLSTTLSQEHLLVRLEEELEKIRPVIHKEASRWNRQRNREIWEEAAETAREFIRNRESFVRRYVYQGVGRQVPPVGATPTPTPTPGIPVPTPTPTPQGPVSLGIFEAHRDIGGVAAPGDAVYSSNENAYGVLGSGVDVWGTADEFHFLYKPMTGSFSFDAFVQAQNQGTSDWVKAMLMARETLSAGSKNFAVRIRESNNQISSQWRSETNSDSFSTPENQRVNAGTHNNNVRIVRDGDTFQSFYLNPSNNNWVLIDSETIPMGDTIYVGLAVTSHDDGNYAVGAFLNVALHPLEVPVMDWMHY